MTPRRMSFWKDVSPTGAVGDLAQVWRKPNPYRWRILAVSVAATFTMLLVLIPKSERIEPRAPKITYIATFDPHRTEAQIIASNIANQKVQDKRRAEDAVRDEQRKQFFRTLGRATWIDVDKMEADAKRQQAAEDAAKAKAAKEARAAAAAPAPAAVVKPTQR
ncbi:MAG: hypothetical protein ABIP41_08400 [Croceibacterium sp.]